MEISNRTTVGEASPFLKGEHFEHLLEICDPMPLPHPVIKMTVGEFIEALDEHYALDFIKDREELLVVAVGRVKQFRKEMEDVSKILKQNEIKPTTEEISAQRGVIFPSFKESILCDCLEWFNLHSLDEAENIPLSNYLILKRKKSAEALYERNLNKIYTGKNKQGKRK